MKPIRTSERGRELANKRWAQSEHVARRALRDATGASSAMAGWGMVVFDQVKQARAGKAGATAAAAFVGRAAGMLRGRDGRAAVGDGVGISVHLDQGAAVALGGLLGRLLGK